jgi:hypothetical protein
MKLETRNPSTERSELSAAKAKNLKLETRNLKPFNRVQRS